MPVLWTHATHAKISTHANHAIFLTQAKILWIHATHAKISTHANHAIFLTHDKSLQTHATHATHEPMYLRTHATHATHEPTPPMLFSRLQNLSLNIPLNFNTVLISIILCMRRKINWANQPLF